MGTDLIAIFFYGVVTLIILGIFVVFAIEMIKHKSINVFEFVILVLFGTLLDLLILNGAGIL